jgi:hypothetical protein
MARPDPRAGWAAHIARSVAELSDDSSARLEHSRRAQMPASEAPRRNSNCSANMLLASISGTTTIRHAPPPATRCLSLAQQIQDWRCQKASSPSTNAPVNRPRSAIFDSSTASTLERMRALAVLAAQGFAVRSRALSRASSGRRECSLVRPAGCSAHPFRASVVEEDTSCDTVCHASVSRTGKPSRTGRPRIHRRKDVLRLE